MEIWQFSDDDVGSESGRWDVLIVARSKGEAIALFYSHAASLDRVVSADPEMVIVIGGVVHSTLERWPWPDRPDLAEIK